MKTPLQDTGKKRLKESASVRFDTPVGLQRLARLFCLSFVLLIFSLSIFGRVIADTFSSAKYYAPLLGLLLIAALLRYLLSIQVERTPTTSTDEPRQGELGRLSLLTLSILMGSAYLSELLIVDPIERIHFVKYGLLTIGLFLAQEDRAANTKIGAASLFALSVGTMDESLQYFVPSRVFDFRDVVLNGVGALFGAVFLWLALLWRENLSARA